MSDIDEIKQELSARDAEIQKVLGELGSKLTGASAEARANYERLDKLLAADGELNQRLVDLEQKASAAGKAAAPQKPQSWGAKLAEDEVFKRFAAQGGRGDIRRTGRIELGPRADVNPLSLSRTAATAGNAGVLVQPDLLPGIQQDPRRTLTIEQLLFQGRTTKDSIKYLKHVGTVNAAAPVPEHAPKPYSSWTFADATAEVATIAHLAKASNQILADLPQLDSFLRGEMTFMLDEAVEDQLLLGDGVGENLLGLIPQATAYNAALTLAGMTNLDIIRRAALQVRLARFRPTAIVLSALDFDAIQGIKDTTGGYLFANPQGVTDLRLWGLPVVESPAMPDGQFMVGAFATAATLLIREDTSVLVSSENEDDFARNRVTFRAERRLGLAVRRPQSFVHGEFPDATP